MMCVINCAGRERGSSGLVIYDHDPSTNSEANESSQLFDSKYVPLVNEGTNRSDIVQPNVKSMTIGKVSRKKTYSCKQLEETMM